MSGQPRRHYFQYARHVNSSLNPDRIHFYKDHPTYVDRRFPLLKPEWFQDLTSGIVKGYTVLPWLEDTIRSMATGYDYIADTKWEAAWSATRESLRLQIQHLTQGLSHADPGASLSTFDRAIERPDLKTAAFHKAFILAVHSEIMLKAESGPPFISLESIPGVELHGDLVVLKTFPTGPLIISYQMVT